MSPSNAETAGVSAPDGRWEFDSGQQATEAPLQLLQSFFDRIYVVSMERNADRRERMQRNLRGLPLTYIGGVDGRLLSDEEVREVYDDRAAQEIYGRSLSRGQLGCALSHRMIYQDMIENQLDRVLILEDDATLCQDNLPSIESILTQLPTDWDFLYLYTIRRGETFWLDLKIEIVYPLLNAIGIRRYPVDAIRRIHSRRYSPNLRVAGQHWSAIAYAVTRPTAERMLHFQTPVCTVADDVTRMICATGGINAYLSVPNIFKQGSEDSTIWNRPARSSSVASAL
jgi:glycosyl transferase family 25